MVTREVIDFNKLSKALQIGNPRLLTVVFAMPGDKEQEKELHKRFRKYRIHGEWFYPKEKIINIMDKNKRVTSLEILEVWDYASKGLSIDLENYLGKNVVGGCLENLALSIEILTKRFDWISEVKIEKIINLRYFRSSYHYLNDDGEYTWTKMSHPSPLMQLNEEDFNQFSSGKEDFEFLPTFLGDKDFFFAGFKPLEWKKTGKKGK